MQAGRHREGLGADDVGSQHCSAPSRLSVQVISSPGAQAPHLCNELLTAALPPPGAVVLEQLSQKRKRKRKLFVLRLVSKTGVISSGQVNGPEPRESPSFLRTSHLQTLSKTPSNFNRPVSNGRRY